MAPRGPVWFQVIGFSRIKVFLVVVLQVVLYGAGRFEGKSRMMLVATFSQPL
jgi:hypothetical protein